MHGSNANYVWDLCGGGEYLIDLRKMGHEGPGPKIVQ